MHAPTFGQRTELSFLQLLEARKISVAVQMRRWLLSVWLLQRCDFAVRQAGFGCATVLQRARGAALLQVLLWLWYRRDGNVLLSEVAVEVLQWRTRLDPIAPSFPGSRCGQVRAWAGVVEGTGRYLIEVAVVKHK